MGSVSLTINGKTISCSSEESLLDVADKHGFLIPRLCHHPELHPYGACRICIVEEEKSGRVMAACVTPANQGMIIQTASERVLRHRRNIVRLMMAEHPESCVVCNKGNRCRLRQIAAQLGVAETRLYPMPNFTMPEPLNAFITRDLSKCILCGKCIRADHELVSVGAIDYNLRGFHSRPSVLLDRGLEDSDCTFCGTCLSMCPTGALSATYPAYAGTPMKESNTICGFCGVGCTLSAGIVDGQIVEINPSNHHGTVNGATLCVRGHFAHDFLNSENRLVHPLARSNGKLEPVAWNVAIENAVQSLRSVKNTHGPQSLAFLGSSKCTNEENYLFQKLARTIYETGNIDNGGFLFGRSLVRAFERRIGAGPKQMKDILDAEAILVIGADVCQSAPVFSYHIKKAANKGVPIVVIDPAPTSLSDRALWLPVGIGSDTWLIYALIKVLILHNNLTGQSGDYHEVFKGNLAKFNLNGLIKTAGIDESLVIKAANVLKHKKISFVVGRGVLLQQEAQRVLDALLNLALLTGSISGKASGFYFPTYENNAAGADDMGACPDGLPGAMALTDEKSRRHWEKAWKVRLSPDNGLDMEQMIAAAENGTIKAMYIMGENPLRSMPDPLRVKKALEKLEFLVVQDILLTETAGMAHLVLPGAAACEKAGSFTNMEGRIQVFSQTVSPPAMARPDWEILDEILAKASNGNRYKTVEHISLEICRFTDLYSASDRRNYKPFRQTAVNPDPILFSPVTFPEVPDSKDCKVLIGSLRYHSGGGTRTGFSKRIQATRLTHGAVLSPAYAKDLKLNEGDSVRIKSPAGTIEREISFNHKMPSGRIWIASGSFNNDVMHLLKLDRQSGRSCSVQIEKI